MLSRSLVSRSCDPMDCSPPGSSVHGILQARILERVAISFSRGSSQPREVCLLRSHVRKRPVLVPEHIGTQWWCHKEMQARLSQRGANLTACREVMWLRCTDDGGISKHLCGLTWS